MNKYLVRNFKWRENLGKVPAKVYRLAIRHIQGVISVFNVTNKKKISFQTRKR